MGMFDPPKTFRDEYEEGQEFLLEDARLGSEIKTDYGTGIPVLLKITGTWYSVFGQGLTQQVERMEDGDLPARVRLERVKTRSGMDVKQLVPVTTENVNAADQSSRDSDDIPF